MARPARSEKKAPAAVPRPSKSARAKAPRAAETSSLKEYSARRAFDATPEPAPTARTAQAGPLLFVIQQHAARRRHYDFRLECDGVLKSWAVPKGPSLDPADKRLAVQTEDHPYEYASFEGVIPRGQYGAGEVIVWDCGVYSPEDDGERGFEDRAAAQRRVREGLENGKLSFMMRGEKVKGSFALVRSSDRKNWFLIKHRDPHTAKDTVARKTRSVLSGLTLEEIKTRPVQRIAASHLVPAGKTEAMPTTLEPMHAELVDAPFTRSGWMWEPKLDGYRVLAFVTRSGVKLRSRRGLDLTAAFPRLAAELAAQGASMIIDGEIVALDAAGRPSFNALQNRVQLKGEREIAGADRKSPVVYYCFDLLHYAGVNLRDAPYRDRRRYLAQCLLPSALVQLVHASEDGEGLYKVAVASSFEGVIGKRVDSPYQSGRRSAAWLKVKPANSAEFVVGGYTKGKGAREPLGALLVGYRDGKALRYASHVGSGFDARTLAQLQERLEALRATVCPFAETPELRGPTTWVKPEIVVEVKFQNWTEDGRLRAPVLLRVRDDVAAKDVRRAAQHRSPGAGRKASHNAASSDIDEVVQQLENRKSAFTIAVGAHHLRLTNLDRVYWPADAALKQPPLKKRDLLRYFTQVSPCILPHLRDRPLTMIRMPEGIHGQRFFQKHWRERRPEFVETVTVYSEHNEERQDYLLCNNLPTLLWLAQSGTLEFHVWHSRAHVGPDTQVTGTDYASSVAALEASVLNYPDYIVFDIDPYIYSGKEKAGAEPELNKVAFDKGREVAFWLRELLLGMSLEALVKTSGKTGLHVFVPIRRTIDFDTARHVSEIVGRHLMRRHPGVITMEWSVPKRTGKIFMDYNMNVRGKTLNVAYSPRGVAGAPVSMPLSWEELASAHPLDFTLTNVPRRLAQTGDRWSGALDRKQSIERALERAAPPACGEAAPPKRAASHRARQERPSPARRGKK